MIAEVDKPRLWMQSASFWIGCARWAVENGQPERALADLERARAALPPNDLLHDDSWVPWAA